MLRAGAPDVTGVTVVPLTEAGQVAATSNVAVVSVGVTTVTVPGLTTVNPVMFFGAASCQIDWALRVAGTVSQLVAPPPVPEQVELAGNVPLLLLVNSVVTANNRVASLR